MTGTRVKRRSVRSGPGVDYGVAGWLIADEIVKVTGTTVGDGGEPLPSDSISNIVWDSHSMSSENVDTLDDNCVTGDNGR